MTITGVSGYSSGSSTANEISQLQKQITQLQNKISETQTNDDLDEDTKSQQVTLYQNQLAQLQTQLAQAQKSGGAQSTQAASQLSESDLLSLPEEEQDAAAVQVFGAGQYLDESV